MVDGRKQGRCVHRFLEGETLVVTRYTVAWKRRLEISGVHVGPRREERKLMVELIALERVEVGWLQAGRRLARMEARN